MRTGNRNIRAATGLIVLSILLYACSTGYYPVDNTKQIMERPVRWLKGKADSISIMLISNKHDANDFMVILVIDKFAKVDSLALSDIRVALTETGEPQDRYVLQRINFYRHLSSGPRVMLNSITGSQLSEKQHFELSEGGPYVLHYYYSRAAMRHYPTKLNVRLEANLLGRETSDTFRVSVDFRRHSKFEMLR